MAQETLTKEVRRIIQHRLFIVMLAVVVVLVDIASGPRIQFPVFFVVPVLLASMAMHARLAIFLVACLPAVRVLGEVLWNTPWSPYVTAANWLISSIVLVVIASLGLSVSEKTRKIKTLTGILPVCCRCKRIRADEEKTWVPLEDYVLRHSETRLSHTYCPECEAKELSTLQISGR